MISLRTALRLAAPAAVAALLAAAPGVGRAAEKAADKVRTVEMTISDAGTQPAQVSVKKGEHIRLAITRKTDRTCVTEIQAAGLGIQKQPLPLNKTAVVEFTADKPGKVKLLCGMGMEFGTVVVDG
jgi:plastocyanin domain-containing protein